MLWVAATVTFFSFCHSGKVTVVDEAKSDPSADLSLSDVTLDNPVSLGITSLLIKQSKTDQERMGIKVFIGKTADDLCPF